MARWRMQVVVLAAAFLVSIPILAQTVTGTMNGSVSDRSGGALPGVTVTIRSAETGFERVVVTSKDGTYNAPFLPIGKYDVQADLAGFGTMRHQGVRVDLNQTVVQDFILDPALQETVTVAADAPHIDVSDGEIKQTMRSEEIMSIPMSSQTNFLRLAATFSGYQENPTSGQDNPTLSSGSSANFNGAGTRGTTFQINGVNNDDSSENQNRQGVAIATIKSFQVLTNNYSAEFGRGYGAVVLVQTKSGTNNIDGELYGYGQDNKYISRNPFTVSLAHGTHYRRQFGATAGFPIIHDTLFGYANIDEVQDKGSGVVTRGVFTPEDLDPAKRLTLGNDTPENRAFQDKILSYFPNVTPNATNLNSHAYQTLVGSTLPDKDASVRTDWNANQSNTLTGRYQRSHQLRQPGEIVRGESAWQDNRQSNFGLTYTGVLSSNTVQEARLGIGLRSTNVNISAGNDTPVVRFAGISGITFTILGNAGAFPIDRNQRDSQLVYNISTSRWAKHTLKAGIDLRDSQLNDRADNFNRGFWNFGSSCAGVNYGTGIAAFWAGCISSYQLAIGPNSLQNSIEEQNLYVQDDFRPFDNLTLNIGGRYERAGAPKEDKNRVDYIYDTTSYVDPRLGFAYTPEWDSNQFWRALTGGSGKFSIRGGFGIFHGRVFQSIFSQGGANVRYNPPNAVNLNPLNQTNLADPTNGFVFVPGQPLTQRVSLTLIDPNLKMPETHQFNLTLERQLFWQSRLRMSYIGTRGRDLLQYKFDNLPIAPSDPRSKFVVAGDWQCAGTGTVVAGATIAKTTACPNVVPIADNEISLRVPRTNDRRPDARYTTNLVVANIGKSWYNAGQIEWESGVHAGFDGRLTYTYSKATDTGSEATAVGAGDINIFPPDEDFAKGPSRFDTRHRFTAVAAYMLPWLQNRHDFLGAALGGWQVSTVIRLASGTPFTIVDAGAADVDFDGVSNLRPVVVNPAYNGGLHVDDPNTSKGQMPASAFRHPVYGDTLKDLIGRNTYYSDGLRQVDLGLYKTFGAVRGMSLMFRLDAFNIFNTASYGIPNNDFNTAGFGTITGTSISFTPRTLQAGFRFLY
jgi:hypothetical protein